MKEGMVFNFEHKNLNKITIYLINIKTVDKYWFSGILYVTKIFMSNRRIDF